MKNVNLKTAVRLRVRLEASLEEELRAAKNRFLTQYENIILDYLNEDDKVKFMQLPWK